MATIYQKTIRALLLVAALVGAAFASSPNVRRRELAPSDFIYKKVGCHTSKFNAGYEGDVVSLYKDMDTKECLNTCYDDGALIVARPLSANYTATFMDCRCYQDKDSYPYKNLIQDAGTCGPYTRVDVFEMKPKGN